MDGTVPNEKMTYSQMCGSETMRGIAADWMYCEPSYRVTRTFPVVTHLLKTGGILRRFRAGNLELEQAEDVFLAHPG